MKAQLADITAALRNDRDNSVDHIVSIYRLIGEMSDRAKQEFDDTTDHINAIHRKLEDIHDYLWPLVHKIFPKFAESKKQIDAFMKKHDAESSRKKKR